ncbi:MAG: hypothetical protein ACOX7P_04965 [Oscillospiraceae bacterium]|jgi:hypothetical protein
MKSEMQTKQPVAAWVILVVAAVLCIIFGGGRSLKNERSRIEDVFYNGVKGDGISIAGDMNKRATVAEKLASLADNYGVATQALESAIKSCKESGGPSELAEGNAALEKAVFSVYNALANADLTKADQKSARSLYDEFNSRGNTMKNDGYNALAEKFNTKTIREFPAGIIARIRRIKPLALFR